MKLLLRLLAAFALAVALSLALRAWSGYAQFVLPPWRVEVSLGLLALLLAAGFVAGYFVVRVVSQALRLPAQARTFRLRQRENSGRAAIVGALQALFEGRFGHAEKLAARASELGAVPALAGLVAARAAQRQREFARRDRWLERAAEEGAEWRQARLMTQAELLIEERRFAEARTVLRELHASGPKHIATLLLLLRAEQGLGDWEEVIRIARLLEKRDAVPAEAIERIRADARIALLSRTGSDPAGFARAWGDVPEAERTQPRIAAAAARAFMRLGDCRAAHRIIEAAIEREWNGELVLLYGECAADDTLERLERAERWLRAHAEDAGLLLTLGRLCVQRELWGKAQSYFEASLALQPARATHAALAGLFDRIGRAADANRHYRAGADPGVVGEPR